MKELSEDNNHRDAIILAIISLTLVLITIPRIHYNLFWGDECFSILSARSFDSFIEMGLGDAGANPILYYFMVYSFRSIFGNTPETYHILSFIPWLIMLLIANMYMRKKYGFVVTFIFIILMSLLPNSLIYILEVRSYEWDVLFVLVSFLSLHRILEDHKTEHYCIFVISSLLGAHSHYYCVLAVAFFYLIVIIDALFNNKYMKKAILTVVVTVIGYIPWMIITIKEILKTTGSFWITETPGVLECLEWIFRSDLSLLFVIVLIISTVFVIIKESKRENHGSKSPSPLLLWLIAGFSSVIGSVFLSIIISDLYKPLLVVRYLYPVSIIAWLLLSFSISNCIETNINLKKTITIVTIIMIMTVAIPSFHDSMASETTLNERTSETLDVLQCINQNDFIITNVQHFDWTILDYYLPGVEHNRGYKISPYDLPTLDPSVQYYLMIYERMDDKIIAELESQNYSYEVVLESATIDFNIFNVYRIVPAL